MKKKIIRYTLSILLVSTITLHVVAQSFEDLYETGCQIGQHLPGDWSWICRAGKLIDGLSGDLESLYTELGDFAQETFNNLYDDAILTLAGKIPIDVIDDALDKIESAMDEGPEALKDAIREVTDDVRLSHLAELRNSNPEDLIEALKNPNELRTYKQLQLLAELANPNVRIAKAELAERQANVIASQGEAEVNHIAQEELGKQIAEDNSTRDTVAKVLAPGIPSIPGVPFSGGTASQLELSAKTAVSTRAAVQVLSEGVADLMRQEATMSGSITEHLKVLSQQQVLTSWQLKLQTQAMNEQINQEIEREKRKLDSAIARHYEDSVTTSQQLMILGDGLRQIANPPSLEFDERWLE